MKRLLHRGPRLSLRWHLVLLVACTLVPMLLFAVGLVIRQSAQQRAAVDRRLVETARALSTALDQEMASTLSALQVLAVSSALEHEDLHPFYEEATRVVHTHEAWLGIRLTRPDGQHVIDTLEASGAAPLLWVGDPDSFRESLRSGQPVIGNLTRSGDAGSPWAFRVRVPVIRDGRLLYVLTGVVRSHSLADVISRHVPPVDEWTRAFIDRRGIIGARTRGSEQFVGHSATPKLVELIRTRTEAMFRDTTLDGVDVYVAVSRARTSGWTAAIAMPVERVESPMRRSLAVTAAVGLALLGAAGLAAFVLARRIAAPIADAAAAAQALAHGAPAVLAPAAVKEIAELGEALEQSADRLGQREAERELLLARTNAARAEAELANRSKDDFLATLSHELRTPLAAILGWVRLLREGRLDPSRTAHAIEVIERNARLQTKLINDLLDVSRIVAGKLRLEQRPTDLRRVVGTALETIRPLTDDKRIWLDAVLGDAPLVVRGDEGRLGQVVGNLLANAVKFTPAGGVITVRLEGRADTVTVLVRDTGVGIASSLLPHIFERFRQGDGISTTPGLGLGLAIVRHITELHGGHVAVSSEGEGRGATFVVTLPLAANAGAGPPGSPARPPAASLAGVRVLVVDDVADTRQMLADVLELRHAVVKAVASVGEARAALDTFHPDVLISDVRMPDRDGYALIAEVRGRETRGGARLPAIALTGYADDEDGERAQRAGFDTHLLKPVDPATLVAAIADLVDPVTRRG